MGAVTSGRVVRVAGPLVEVRDVGPVAMHDLVSLGPSAIPGEVVAIRDGLVSLQAYEYTGGLGPGAAAVPAGRPLSVRLGPGLLGRVFDGLLRPLSAAPAFLTPGAAIKDGDQSWRFEARVSEGEVVEAGQTLGVVADAGALEHRVLVPPGTAGVVESLADGKCEPDAVIATVGGAPVCLTANWPVRVPRPGLCTDNGAMVAALGAEMVARGRTPSALDLPADSSMQVDVVLA